jgi:hypothetical protein
MHNLLKNGAILIAALMICFSFANCVTAPPSVPVISGSSIASGEYDYIVINQDGVIMQTNITPARDFTALGLVFAESTATFDSKGNIIEGSTFLNDMLMREAQKLGADDVLNLKVDEIENISVVEEIKTVPTKVTGADGTSRTVNREMRVQTQTKTVHYKASALAVKYTNFIPLPDANIAQDTFYTEEVPMVVLVETVEPQPVAIRPSASAPAPIRSPVQAADLDTWRNKWVYLGGAIGGGTDEEEHVRYDNNGNISDTRTFTYGLVAGGVVADVALFKFLSLGVILGLGGVPGGDGIFPVLPILAKLGYRFSRAEASFDMGYTAGLGFTLGGTLGVKAGPGVFFTEVLFVPDPTINDATTNVFVGVLGYKAGIGNKR